jgi:hypothetical protein
MLETIAFWLVIAFIWGAIPLTAAAIGWLLWRYYHTNY